MSENRRHVYADGEVDNELTFEGFLDLCRTAAIVRVQGKVESKTKAKGRLVRFNRAVLVYPDSVRFGKRTDEPYVIAERVRWSPKEGIFVLTGVKMRLTWRLLDWVSWTATGDPNGTWLKVTEIGDAAASSRSNSDLTGREN